MPNPTATINKAIHMCSEYYLATVNLQNQTRAIPKVRNVALHWRPPPADTFKCNSDASWSSSSHPCALAFVVRDCRGTLITGHAKKAPAFSPLVAEALALRESVVVAYNLDWKRVIFESDNLNLIRACRKEKPIAEIQMIVQDILTVAEGFIHCGFTWVQRKGNEVAHHVSQAMIRETLPLSWVSQPPLWLRNLLIATKTFLAFGNTFVSNR
ncbi:Ribonuclease H-like superfamily [Sesbania bispinosa]|nr:Ribonuclease H-like superfamily [Sesbania bispinosa]